MLQTLHLLYYRPEYPGTCVLFVYLVHHQSAWATMWRWKQKKKKKTQLVKWSNLKKKKKKKKICHLCAPALFKHQWACTCRGPHWVKKQHQHGVWRDAERHGGGARRDVMKTCFHLQEVGPQWLGSNSLQEKKNVCIKIFSDVVKKKC